MKKIDQWMRLAIDEAKKGLASGGIPIGSVLVHEGQVLGSGHNQRIQEGSVIKHGEMDALEKAGRLPASVYQDSILYTTLSPCPMCSGAIVLYGISKVIIGENRTFLGEEDWLRQHGVEVVVVDSKECIEMMENYIRFHPSEWNEDIGV
jgi:cytosine deaminase